MNLYWLGASGGYSFLKKYRFPKRIIGLFKAPKSKKKIVNHGELPFLALGVVWHLLEL